MSTDAKEEILARISAARVPVDGPLGRTTAAASERSRTEIVAQFAEYAAEYRANVSRVEASQLSAAVGDALVARGSDRVVIPIDLPEDWLPAGITPTRDFGLSHTELDGISSVITGCAVAIAETGTVVLDAGESQGRRAITLLPDHHVCVVFEYQIVDSVVEAVAVLGEAIRHGQPLTWISGPSATSDIELSRVEGVHGPRNLDILIVG